MSANLFGMYASVGTTVQELAKSNAEAAAARSARVAGVMQDGYRLWADGVTASLDRAVRTAEDLAKARTPAEVIAVQRDWLESTGARVANDVRAIVDLSAKLVAGTVTAAAPKAAAAAPAKPPAAAPAPATPTAKTETPVIEAPKADTPKAEATPAAAPVAPVIAVAAEPAAAPAAKTAPAARKPAARSAASAAPKAAPKAAPVEAEAPKPAETTPKAAPKAAPAPSVE
ncbi:phasin family protein [Azospirillum halopraeferens]|uniref:phasin family protein n=1 Tax=Azospirillum halopraeferens TaxID=34010 RepID=UPI00040FF0DF|nr:phasin family protein [Azospirillum halopraeferens]